MALRLTHQLREGVKALPAQVMYFSKTAPYYRLFIDENGCTVYCNDQLTPATGFTFTGTGLFEGRDIAKYLGIRVPDIELFASWIARHVAFQRDCGPVPEQHCIIV